MSKIVSTLYRLARLANDIEKYASGDPKKMLKRTKNKYLGRKLVSKIWKLPF